MRAWIRMYACSNWPTSPPCKHCSHCCQALLRFLGKFVRPVFCHFCSKLGVVFSFAQIYFKHHLLSFFSQNIPPPGIMDCCLPCDRSAAHSTQWQDLELTLLFRLTQHGNRRARRERVVDASLRPAEMFMRACMKPTEAECCRIQRFLWYAYTACFRVIQTRKTLCALRVYT